MIFVSITTLGLYLVEVRAGEALKSQSLSEWGLHLDQQQYTSNLRVKSVYN